MYCTYNLKKSFQKLLSYQFVFDCHRGLTCECSTHWSTQVGSYKHARTVEKAVEENMTLRVTHGVFQYRMQGETMGQKKEEACVCVCVLLH